MVGRPRFREGAPAIDGGDMTPRVADADAGGGGGRGRCCCCTTSRFVLLDVDIISDAVEANTLGAASTIDTCAGVCVCVCSGDSGR